MFLKILLYMKKTRINIRESTLRKGISYPFDEELIMLILGSGSQDLPIDLLAEKVVETLDDSNETNVIENLQKIKGIGESKALSIAAALELGKRRSVHLKALIKTPNDIIPFIRHYAMYPKERFILVTLNGSHEIIQIHVISVGTINNTIIHPREIFSEAIKENASAMILCHNHPSGNCAPSDDDIKTTRNLLEASKIIGIPILDHIIIDVKSYFSFLEHNLLFTVD